jgi:hypothetical protein
MMQRWADYCDALKAGKTPAEAADVALSAPSVVQGYQRRKDALKAARMTADAPQDDRETMTPSEAIKTTARRLKGRLGVRVRKARAEAGRPDVDTPPWEVLE